jgi:hypothetical protein
MKDFSDVVTTSVLCDSCNVRTFENKLQDHPAAPGQEDVLLRCGKHGIKDNKQDTCHLKMSRTRAIW